MTQPPHLLSASFPSLLVHPSITAVGGGATLSHVHAESGSSHSQAIAATATPIPLQDLAHEAVQQVRKINLRNMETQKKLALHTQTLQQEMKLLRELGKRI